MGETAEEKSDKCIDVFIHLFLQRALHFSATIRLFEVRSAYKATLLLSGDHEGTLIVPDPVHVGNHLGLLL
jgi:hypothetical protein